MVVRKKGHIIYNLYESRIVWNYMPPKLLFPPLLTQEELHIEGEQCLAFGFGYNGMVVFCMMPDTIGYM